MVFHCIDGLMHDGLQLTSWRPCWWSMTKEYLIIAIVGTRRHCVPNPKRLIANQGFDIEISRPLVSSLLSAIACIACINSRWRRKTKNEHFRFNISLTCACLHPLHRFNLPVSTHVFSWKY